MKHLLWYLEADESIPKSKASGLSGILDFPATPNGWAQGVSEDKESG